MSGLLAWIAAGFVGGFIVAVLCAEAIVALVHPGSAGAFVIGLAFGAIGVNGGMVVGMLVGTRRGAA